MDWGQLTNLARQPAVAGVGRAPIGVPIRIIGVNNGSGTAATFYNFAQSGIGTPAAGEPATDCAGGSGQRLEQRGRERGVGADPDANQGPAGSNFVQNLEIALENDANQIGDFASANWPSDPADQAMDIATSLYYMGFGVFGVNTNAATATHRRPGRFQRVTRPRSRPRSL